MSTSFSVTRDDIILAALKGVGALDRGVTPDSADITDCSFSLNLILKSWIATGMPLWKVAVYTLPLTAGISAYSIGPSAFGSGTLTTNRPLRILNAVLRDSSNQDQILQIISRQEYNDLGTKFGTSADPTALWYQSLSINGLLTTWPTPSDATKKIVMYVQVPINDVTAATDTMDFPNECYRALKWALMDEIAEDYRAADSKIARIERKAKMYKDEMENWSVEESSLYLTYDNR